MYDRTANIVQIHKRACLVHAAATADTVERVWTTRQGRSGLLPIVQAGVVRILMDKMEHRLVTYSSLNELIVAERQMFSKGANTLIEYELDVQDDYIMLEDPICHDLQSMRDADIHLITSEEVSLSKLPRYK